MVFSQAIVALAFGGFAHAATHELIVGTFKTKLLYTLEFDDVATTLSLVANTTTPAPNSWIALSHDRKNLYGTSFNTQPPSFASYSLANATSIRHDTTLAAGGRCTGSSIFVVADHNPPHAVYGSFFGGSAGCGAVMSVDSSGRLAAAIQNYTYSSSSGVHGVALNPDSRFLYSADDSGNALWTHSIDPSTGKVTPVANLSGPSAKSDPRHVAVHPNGQYLYAVLEGASQIAQYAIDRTTGIPSLAKASHTLIKPSDSASGFWADEVALSFSGSYLWATNRARQTNSGSTAKGYISAFDVDQSGAILRQKFLLPTTTSGGSANSVAPSRFSDRFVALTDSSVGFVEIWELAQDGISAGVVAHLDLADGGCCANAVWYS